MKLKDQEIIKVVLDTNIIISAAISKDGNPAKIFELLLLEKIENFTTWEIIEEIKEVFERQKIKEITERKDREFIINTFQTFSKVVEPKEKFEIISDDKDDNKFLECAIEGNVDCIISGDPHLIKVKRFKNIEIITPKEFITKINS